MNKIYNPKKIEKLLQKKNNLLKMHETIMRKQDEEVAKEEMDNVTVTSCEEESQERMKE